MNKTLKFRPQFIKSILEKDSIVTTRLFDDKNLSVGDTVDLLDSETGEKFAIGKIIKIKVTTFEELAQDSPDEDAMHDLYDMYADYHNKKINPEDEVKWITFDLIDTLR